MSSLWGGIPDFPNAPVLANVDGLTFALTGGTFIGLVDSTPFIGTVSTANNGLFSIDQIALQTVPEPSSLLLLGLGLILLLMGWQGRQPRLTL